MGSSLVNCCENSSTKQNELTLAQPSTIGGPHQPLVTAASLELGDLQARVQALQALECPAQLTLTVLTSQCLPAGQKLLIEPLGLRDSLRSPSDGCVFFGQQAEEGTDFVLAGEVPARHFVVYYRLEKSSYWVRDLGMGPGVYIKLDFALVLKDKMLVNIGESFLFIRVTDATTLVVSVYQHGQAVHKR